MIRKFRFLYFRTITRPKKYDLPVMYIYFYVFFEKKLLKYNAHSYVYVLSGIAVGFERNAQL